MRMGRIRALLLSWMTLEPPPPPPPLQLLTVNSASFSF